MSQTRPSLGADAAIRIRGARQNNLRSIDCDLPLGKLIVITGPSGSGKSSLAFDTVYAEGQRRYIETFSPYTRQFFERMNKPLVDQITDIPPAIALEQNNSVRTSRSTVGTLTDINEYLKQLLPRVVQGRCLSCEREIRVETAGSIVRHILANHAGETLLVTFSVAVPTGRSPEEFFAFLTQQGYLRVWLQGKVVRTDDPTSTTELPSLVPVIQDRIELSKKNKARLTEAVETALLFGKGRMAFIHPQTGAVMPWSKGWHCAHCDLEIRPPTPSLFSFNHPVGACPECKGFGRSLGFDPDKAIPNRALSLKQGCVKMFAGQMYQECQRDLIKMAREATIDVDKPFMELPTADQTWVMEGDPAASGMDPEEVYSNGLWYGVRGFYDWLETKTYKMHVRIFLSRFRSATPCSRCGGGRYQPDTLRFRLRLKGDDFTLPELASKPVSELLPLLLTLDVKDSSTQTLLNQIQARLSCLVQVGLGYLTLDRTTRTLSGGELQRVNLTSCIGAQLVNTLFVLDEPTIGLHPRDTDRLISVLRALRDRGNTLLVVEHEEAVMRAADELLEIGPGRGEKGGQLVFQGSPQKMEHASETLTAAYLKGTLSARLPSRKRPPQGWLEVIGASAHNIKNMTVRFPIGCFTCVTGVSGSGKSTLVHTILHRNLLKLRGLSSEETAGQVDLIKGDKLFREVVLVDQSPLTKTPRSTPAVYVGAFEGIRKLFAETADAVATGFRLADFSFNTGNGRCDRCGGSGYEKVEMQFLSDVHVRCSDCDGRRFIPALLRVKLDGHSIHNVLEMTVSEAIHFFRRRGRDREIVEPLSRLEEVGLGYLRLGQPLNTLSGGESQRLKLVAHLATKKETGGDLLIFDEPTTGLHFDDIAQLLKVFHRLADEGNTLIVIEHNLDVVASADHVIDVGPEAGDAGGEIVAEGTPEQMALAAHSWTGRYLKQHLGIGKASTKQMTSHRVAEPVGLYLAAREHTSFSRRITVRGAREHNLKNINIDLPRDELVVITGLSGSGKSSLAFDLLFAEGQRRFLDSMSPYARQFVEQMEKPEVDEISGLPPSVAIEQRLTRGGGKSTVATVTEVYHFARLLFSKLGTQYCPTCDLPVEKQSIAAIVAKVEASLGRGKVRLLAPLIKARKGFHTEVADWAGRQGYKTLLVDGALVEVSQFRRLERFKEHTIDVVVGDATKNGAALRELITRAIEVGKGTAKLLDARNKITVLSTEMSCPGCGKSFEELDPRLFSFNSPHGWCQTCRGFGTIWQGAGFSGNDGESQLEAELREERQREWAEEAELLTCPDCCGSRLNETARHVKLGNLTIDHFAHQAVSQAIRLINSISLRGSRAVIAKEILREIAQRLEFMKRVGLGYLALDRGARTLSGGESQRIRLAAQLGSTLRGVLYVLDEPTIGLHPRDNERLLDLIKELQGKGNSLVIVEHDEETMKRAGHIIDLGPGAGALGGHLVAEGSLSQILSHPKSLTGRYLREPLVHPLRGTRRACGKKGWLSVKGARANNLKNVDVRLPLGCFTVLTGVSGSGKSSLLRSVIRPAVQKALERTGEAKRGQQAWSAISGTNSLQAVAEVDQSPIGKTSRSTPATYIKVFDEIRKLFAQLPLSRVRGYTASHFSFNTGQGRCEACEGNGMVKIEMNFLPTSHVPCEECHGKRFNPQTLEVEYNGRSIGDVMQMTTEEALALFEASPKIARPLRLLVETGLGYLSLGQASPTLSGGEAQRIKLVTELARGSAGRPTLPGRESNAASGRLYLLEEPTIGLHMADVEKLLHMLHRLVDEGHTVVVIEHNLTVIAEADHIIDMGPGAGEDGGMIVATGTPEEVAQNKRSLTGAFLRKHLKSCRRRRKNARTTDPL